MALRSLERLHGDVRVAIEHVTPVVDGGRYPAKRVVGEPVDVVARIIVDGHDAIGAALRHRQAGEADWQEVGMVAGENDAFCASFTPGALGRFEYTIEAWIDAYESWRRDLVRRRDPAEVIELELRTGSGLLAECAARATGHDADALSELAVRIAGEEPFDDRVAVAVASETAALASAYPDRSVATKLERPLQVIVDPAYAGFSTWYEFFPRSTGGHGVHGTLRDAAAMLGHIAGMGFDVAYLPPIHPVGTTNRKGKNNSPICEPEDVGCPWAIGSAEGGHTAVHPQLGTLEDVHEFVREADRLGMRVALDIAFQCSPDHPLVSAHPEWFRKRADGSIRYAENPPKHYEDIVPFDFSTSAWKSLWAELLGIVLFWAEQGIRIFRVDNPHTKPLRLWEWLIGEVRARYPDAVFLAEAFTRPTVLEGLAKRGFHQSYTYFAWRNTRDELESYLTELTQTERQEYLRPNFWPNTPDILTEYLQAGGRAAFMARLMLAATLAASYGIYGPAFELCVGEAAAPGSEEYLDSEKYQLQSWDLDAPWSLREVIGRVNRIRKEHPALQQNRTLRFHATDNEQLICYSKTAATDGDAILCVVNLDSHYRQAGYVTLDLGTLGLPEDTPYQVHDLLGDGRYLWMGARNYVELDPGTAHIFAPSHHVRDEHDFDYFD